MPPIRSEDIVQEWISAAKALRLLKPVFGTEYGARMAICKRAHAEMIRARAERFQFDNKREDDFEIPALFWWAEGHEALKQDWPAGDFETWTRDKKRRLQAFGVSFARADIEKMLPSPAVEATAAPKSAKSANRQIFIVHGRNHGPQEAVARFLGRREFARRTAPTARSSERARRARIFYRQT
jgi:hypothetical protein